jgi:hypothetical protein
MKDANATTMAIVAEIFAAWPGRFRFTSGLRTAAENAAAGGVEGSFHLTGQAADFVAINGIYPPCELEQIGEIVRRHGYEVIFHNAGSGNHYHIEPAPGYDSSQWAVGSSQPATDNGQPTTDWLLFGLGFLALYLLIDD